MKRFHIHVGVEKLEESIRFYTALFGAEPVKVKTDYAKWLLEDPPVNFAVSTRAKKNGMDHVGIQVDEEEELKELRQRLKAADMAWAEEGETTCCYSRSDKSWIQDPAGIPWEVYRTMEDAQLFSDQPDHSGSACCGPEVTGFISLEAHTTAEAGIGTRVKVRDDRTLPSPSTTPALKRI